VAVNLAAWGGSALTDPPIALAKERRGGRQRFHPPNVPPAQHGVHAWAELAEAPEGAQRWCSAVNAIRLLRLPHCRPDYLAAFQHLADSGQQEAGREGQGTSSGTPGGKWDKARIVRDAPLRVHD